MFIPILSDTIKKKLLPYTLDFATSSFDVAWTAPNWAVSAGTAKNTPTEGAERVTNGGMELDANWSDLGTPVSNTRSNEQAHTDTYSRKVVINENNEGITQGGIFPIGTVWAVLSGWVYGDGVLDLQVGTTDVGGLGPLRMLVNAPASWTQIRAIGRCVRATLGGSVISRSSGGDVAGTFYTDDMSCMLLSNLLAYRNFGVADVRVKAPWTITAGYQAGVVARVSADGSQYLLAYHNGTTCYLLKILTTGTTQLIGIITAYVAGANVEIRCTGNTVQLFYNNSQVGTDQTETTLSSNTRHGLFSTDVSNTVASVNVVRN